MTCFDFVLYHKLGKTMQAEDPLSRRADHEMGIDLDNTNQVLLKPEFFAINALEAVTVVLWTSSHILYGLPLHQKGDVSKATC